MLSKNAGRRDAQLALERANRQRRDELLFEQLRINSTAVTRPQLAAHAPDVPNGPLSEARLRAYQCLRFLESNKRGRVKSMLTVEDIQQIASPGLLDDDELEAFVDGVLQRPKIGP